MISTFYGSEGFHLLAHDNYTGSGKIRPYTTRHPEGLSFLWLGI